MKNPFSTLDQYESQHLVFHLAGAGRVDDLNRILAAEWSPTEATSATDHSDLGDPDVARHNAWFEFKESSEQIQGYIDDLVTAGRALESASRDLLERHKTKLLTIGWEVRYALMESCINAMAAAIPGALLCELVRQGIWTSGQAIAYAHRCPDPSDQLSTLAQIASVVTEEEQKVIIENVLPRIVRLRVNISDPDTIADEHEAAANLPDVKSQVLCALSPYLAAGTLHQAISFAQNAGLTRAVIVLTSRLEPGEALPAFGAVLTGLNTRTPSYVFEFLATHLPLGLVEQACQASLALAHPYQRAEALGFLLDRVSPDQKSAWLTEFKKLTCALEQSQRLELSARVGKYLSAEEMSEIVDSVKGLNWDSERIRILASLLPYLTGDLRSDALNRAKVDAATMSLDSHQYKVQALTYVIPFLDESERRDYVRQALKALLLTDPKSRRGSLSLLAPLLPRDLLAKAVAVARHFESEYYSTLRIRALLSISSEAPGVVSPVQLQRFLNETLAMRSDENRRYVLEALARQLARLALPRLWGVLKKIDSHAIRLQLNTLVSAHRSRGRTRPSSTWRLLQRTMVVSLRTASVLLPETLIVRALRRWIDTEDLGIVSSWDVRLHDGLDRQALEMAMQQTDVFKRCRLLTQLLPHVGPGLQSQIAESVLDSGEDPVRVFSEIVVPYLDKPRLLYFLERAWRASDPASRNRLVLAILSQLNDCEAVSVIDRLLATAAPEQEHRDDFTWIIQEIGTRFSDSQKQSALSIALARPYPVRQVDSLLAIMPYLSNKDRVDTIPKVLQLSLKIAEASDLRDRLARICPLLTELPLSDLYRLWRQALRTFRTRSREHMLADLAGLVPIVATLGGRSALSEAARAIDDVSAWWP